MLDAQVDGELDRLLQPVAGEPRQMQIGEPARVEPFLDPGDALVVDIDVADQMRDLRAIRIDALVLAQKADARYAEPVNLLLLLGCDLALEPHEAALGTEPLAQFAGIHVGHDCGEQFGCLVDVDDPLRLPEQRGHAHVGCQDFTIAVEDVGARGRHRVLRAGTPGPVLLGRRREHDEPCCNDGIADGEDEDGETDASPRLDREVAVACIKQPMHQPRPGLARA